MLEQIIGLRAEATRKAVDAERSRTLAREIEQRRLAVSTRIGPCVRAHRGDVWRSRAATASRVILVWRVGRELRDAQRELRATAAALQRLAEVLDEEARVALTRAVELERLVGQVTDG